MNTSNPVSLENKKHLIALGQLDGIGPVTIEQLIQTFGSAASAWLSPISALEKAGFPDRVLASWRQKDRVDPDEEMGKVVRAGVRLLMRDEADYPELLKQIYQPPHLLYMRGQLKAIPTLALALVGTRKITSYGRQIAEELASQLSGAGLAIVSGLALGVDACAHQATIVSQGCALAVLGSGVDQIYPRTNLRLAEDIMMHGALISEFPMGTAPQPANFPRRNRIISGLSLGTIVVEAGETSGALITASFALEQNREVFAIPGPLTSRQSIGTNRLIQRGAKLVTSAADVLDELNIEITRSHVEARQAIPATDEETALLDLLQNEPLHIDQLVRLARRPASEITSLLTMLEIKGRIRNLGGGIYQTV